jgi:low affinity Fe/Cu permease
VSFGLRTPSFPHLTPSTQHAPGWKDRSWTSRVLHRLDEAGSHPLAGFIAIFMVVGWAAVGLFTGFPGWWATILYGATSSVTFVMVFVIQHTQARQTAATQLKLDELIRATTRADDGLIAVQEAPDEHLHHLTETTVAERAWP